MRFMALLKTAENTELGPPPGDLMAEIMRIGEEATKAGVLLDTNGLAPTAAGSRIRLAGGEITVTDGPFTGQQVASYAMYEADSKDEVIEWSSRFLAAHQRLWPGWEGEAEVRQIFGPEDFAQLQ